MNDDMAPAYVNPDVVKWARERAGLSRREVAEGFGQLTADDIADWESGDAYPTLAQAEVLSQKLRVPFLVFFKSSRPSITIPLPDLRTIGGKKADNLSPNFFDVVTDCLVKQRWYRDILVEDGRKPLDFCGKFTLRTSAKKVAADIAETLGIDHATRRELRNWESLFSLLTERAERAGIIVIRNGQVRFASVRPLDPDEFRGFALSDPIAPLVFVNTKDAPPARIFTLVHELAHLWINKSGISNVDPRVSDIPNETEAFSNDVAAEFLMPKDEFVQTWESSDDVYTNLVCVRRTFKVSNIAALIRARELGALSHELANALIDKEYDAFQNSDSQDDVEESGPTFWSMFVPRSSRLFLSTVFRTLRDHRVTYLDAASILGIRVRTLDSYLKRLEV